jgi:alpha-maltose-1-phosphate synthase
LKCNSILTTDWESIAKTTYDYYQKVLDGFVKEKA